MQLSNLFYYFTRNQIIYIWWLVATRSFLLGWAPNCINAPLLCCWNWIKSFPTATLFLKIFFKRLTPKEQWKLVLTRFNLENVLSSLALETGTVNNNLINSPSLQPLPLGVIKILRHVISLHILLNCTIVPKDQE